MKKYERVMFQKSDIIVITAVFVMMTALIFCTHFSKNQSDKYVVSYNGQEVVSGYLSDDTVFSYKNMTFEVKDHQISVIKTDCEDKICQHTGEISSRFRSIVCVPNKITVTIISDDNVKGDVVVG